jgi:prephenate dehydrogenase
MSIAILGYGLFGRALGQLLREAGLTFRAHDPVAPVPLRDGGGTLAETLRGARWVILAMPVSRMAGALQELAPQLRPGQMVMDVGSVKVAPCALMDRLLGETPHVGTHPLFGPSSLARAERPLRVVICPSASHPGAAEEARGLYRSLDCEILDLDPETHDRNMAQTHALGFFIAKGLLDVGVGEHTPVAPPSFQGLRNTLKSVQGDAGHLFPTIQRENPFATEARARFLEALGDIHQRLAVTEGEGEAIPPSLPDLRERSPELGQVRDLIDEVDRELVTLLQRRTQLALRAARAKAALGAPVLDPARERALLELRQTWARELGLDPEVVSEVFRNLMRASRQAQTHLD